MAPLALAAAALVAGLMQAAASGFFNHRVQPNTLVVARHQEDVSWQLRLRTQDFRPVIYSAQRPEDSPGLRHVQLGSSNGREASAYLQYIVYHYQGRLADITIFNHAHNYSWHLWYKPELLSRLNQTTVMRHGFANLRFLDMPCTMWECNFPRAGLSAKNKPPGWHNGMRVWLNGVTESISELTALIKTTAEQQQHLLPWCSNTIISFDKLIVHFWATADSVIIRELGPRPEYVQSPCCAEFVVTRAAIQRHSLAFWVGLQAYVTKYPACQISFVMEFLWALIFTGNATVLPLPGCELYSCGGQEDLDLGAEEALMPALVPAPTVWHLLLKLLVAAFLFAACCYLLWWIRTGPPPVLSMFQQHKSMQQSR